MSTEWYPTFFSSLQPETLDLRKTLSLKEPQINPSLRIKTNIKSENFEASCTLLADSLHPRLLKISLTDRANSPLQTWIDFFPLPAISPVIHHHLLQMNLEWGFYRLRAPSVAFYHVELSSRLVLVAMVSFFTTLNYTTLTFLLGTRCVFLHDEGLVSKPVFVKYLVSCYSR